MLQWLVDRDITPNIRVKQSPTPNTELYGIEKFTHVPEQNCYICPEGKQLKYTGINRLNRTHLYHSTLKRCHDCSQKDGRTKGKYRVLAIHTCEAARQKVYEAAKTPAFARSQRERRKVKPLFAELKNQIGLRRLRLRRMRFVREQFYEAAVVQNLKRLVRFLSFKPEPVMATI